VVSLAKLIYEFCAAADYELFKSYNSDAHTELNDIAHGTKKRNVNEKKRKHMTAGELSGTQTESFGRTTLLRRMQLRIRSNRIVRRPFRRHAEYGA